MKEQAPEIGTKEFRPQARSHNLVTRELPDEELVYDLKNNQAHCLNKLAAAVWKQCDGILTVQEIAQAVSCDFQKEIDESVIWITLRQLNQSALLVSDEYRFLNTERVSRRQALRKIGWGTIAVPLVTTILAPQAASASSCLANGTTGVPCSNAIPTDPARQCCSGCCKSNADRCEGNIGEACVDDRNCCTGLECRGVGVARACRQA